ncbi:hypothetical protein PTKIN_Ptkin13bG0160400 [Pterospermum kingtungense]
MELLHDYRKALEPNQEKQQHMEHEQWKVPCAINIKINFDDAIRSSIGNDGVGVIVRDCTGMCLGALQALVPDIIDLLTMETYVVVMTLDFASLKGFTNIELKGNAIEVVTALNGETHDLSPPRNVIHEGRIKRRRFQYCKISHVCRHCNQVAYALSRDASIMQDFFKCFECTPVLISDIATAECTL